MKFSFEVYSERHKTVYIEADNADDAYDEMLEQLYDVDMDDAFECGDRTVQMLEVD